MLAFSFIHPSLALAGLAAVALPIIIHLINRRRYRREKWAAMGFLLAANQRSARRITIERWLLLLLRCAVVGLVGAAVARPFFPSARFTPLAESRVHHILIIDNSASMQAIDGGDAPRINRFERAIAAGETLLAAFPAGHPVSIITAAAPAEAVLGHADFDRRQVRDRLRQIAVTDAATDLGGALRIAQDLLVSSPAAPGSRAVYVLSDMQASAWLARDGAASGARPDAAAALVAGASRLARESKLWLVRIGRDVVDNLAVTDLSFNASLAGGELPLRISAELANFGRTVVRGAALEIIRDEVIERTLAIDAIAPGPRRTISFALAIDTPGSHPIQLRFARGHQDHLALDDARYLAVEVVHSLAVLLVDGRHGGGPARASWSGQTGYLATALAPSARPGEKTLLAPRVISEAELEGEPLASYPVIMLCNVGQLEPAIWSRLESFVARGGGLAIFAGDLLNRDNYNRWGYRQGAGLVPGELADAAGEPDGAREPFRYSPESLNHPMLASFAGATDTGLFRTRINRYVPMAPDAAHATVALRYDNGDAAVVTRGFGAGRVCFIGTTANMEWTNLPAKGDYVAFALNLAAWLAPQRGVQDNILVGATLRAPLTPVQSSLPLRVTGPAGATEARLVRSSEHGGVGAADGFELQYDATQKCGLYIATIGNMRKCFAVNLDPRESDLAALDEEGLKRRIDGPFSFLQESDVTAESSGGLRDAPSELATLATGGVLVLLLVEMWLAARFGAQR